ncbi:MAG: class I SAM-dependent methyltransferase [Fluviicola sp.]|nr:class I SAM-dependent methyltransferase [Fluviicola sp.]
MNKDLLKDIVDWDITNWSKAIDYWEQNVDFSSENMLGLELGGNKGGLSLLLAKNNCSVICSDLNSPEEKAKELHKKHGVSHQIQYKAIDATNIGFKNEFDIVIFKSILGGIAGNGKNHLFQKTVDEIYQSLKPGGQLLFSENLESSFLHRFVRKRFVSWGARWNYLKYKEIDGLFSQFETVTYQTVGFFGTFGRSEAQRRFLSKVDAVFSPVIPKSKKYIVYGIARKSREEE